MDLGLHDRPALVTGASSGIGLSCVVQLLAEGARVCAVARDVSPLAALVSEHPDRLVTASCDLTTPEGCDAAVDACMAAFGGVDVLVNSAGAAASVPVLDVTQEDLEAALLLKLHGYLRLSQRVAPVMARRGWGRIVMVAGSAGTSPTADNFPISLANIGVHNLVRSLTDVLTPAGVLVNAVAPGLTRTPRAESLLARRAAEEGVSVEDLVEAVGATLPAGRVAEPEEVARAVCFLASEAASYVQASVLYLDGGARRATP
jgi:3-oxoacyl-[acyl-carrier protein] reductase